MKELSNLLKGKHFYHSLLLLFIFSLLVYPPTVGTGLTQRINITNDIKYEIRIIPSKEKDSLLKKLKRIDSLLANNNIILLKQQYIIKKQKL
jgi:hypothetical protein